MSLSKFVRNFASGFASGGNVAVRQLTNMNQVKIVQNRQVVAAFAAGNRRFYGTYGGHSQDLAKLGNHLDQMPVPEGSWQDEYTSNNRRYTRSLIFGTAFFGFTVYMVFFSGIIFLNYGPPPLPEENQESAEDADKDASQTAKESDEDAGEDASQTANESAEDADKDVSQTAKKCK